MANFEDLTVDIRKAFRLLFNFVNTINGIVLFIRDRLGLNYEGDSQIWGTAPQKNAKNLNNKDLWDWFPIYYYGYTFRKDKPPFSFSIILQCDTGYFDYYNENTIYESDDLGYGEFDKYGDVEKSKTKIIFGLCEGKNVNIIERFDEEWNFEEYKKTVTKDAENEYFLSVSNRSDKNIYFKTYSLSDFKDKDTAEKSLSDFISFLKKNGINKFELIPQ
jgi:hypothetical protein